MVSLEAPRSRSSSTVSTSSTCVQELITEYLTATAPGADPLPPQERDALFWRAANAMDTLRAQMLTQFVSRSRSPATWTRTGRS